MWPLNLLWDSGLLNFTLTLGVLSSLFFFLNALKNWMRDVHIPIRDATKAHNWQTIPRNNESYVCNICEALLYIPAECFYCDCCGVCADAACIKKADSALKCKEISIDNCLEIEHHWVKGNLPGGSLCSACNEECSVDHDLSDFRCMWCLACVHFYCKSQVPKICDFGIMRNFIVPPNHIVLNYKKAHVGRKLRLKAVTDPKWSDWTPVFVLGNRKSGNNLGGEILSGFRGVLNPAQVIDLCERPPSALNEWLSLIPGSAAPIVLVAGGDGTVAWVLSTIYALKPKVLPAVAVVPLGTGNDLSRVLGWGKEEMNPFCAKKVLQLVKQAQPVNLDRWDVSLSPPKHLGLSLPAKHNLMYNYLSVGVDAQVTLDFHRTRSSRFFIFSSRIINKFLYMIFGTQQVMEKRCRNLEQRIELYLDDVFIQLPEIESVVVLNIQSWGAGVQLWTAGLDDSEEDTLPEQSFSDGKLEVVAIYSSFHIAQLQVGLSQPHRIGQAKKVRIKLKSKLPMQIDGEPWVQHPSDLVITYQDQAKLLQLRTN